MMLNAFLERVLIIFNLNICLIDLIRQLIALTLLDFYELKLIYWSN